MSGPQHGPIGRARERPPRPPPVKDGLAGGSAPRVRKGPTGRDAAPRSDPRAHPRDVIACSAELVGARGRSRPATWSLPCCLNRWRSMSLPVASPPSGKILAPTEGVEPPTFAFVARRSLQLSYAGAGSRLPPSGDALSQRRAGLGKAAPIRNFGDPDPIPDAPGHRDAPAAGGFPSPAQRTSAP